MSVEALLTRPVATGPAAADTPPSDWQSPVLSPVELLPIASLLPRLVPLRCDGESAEHARVLADCGGVLPPITVHRATLRVIDGTHRVRAALLRGETVIPARFFEGSESDAFVLGVESNITHGRALSADDRSAAVQRILASHPNWSDRAISAVAGLSPKTVGSIRRSVGASLPLPTVRVGRDGRSRPVDAAAGRLKASELIAENPEASLREIAKAAGISPGTVRDVRDRLRRGEDPVPLRQRFTPPHPEQPVSPAVPAPPMPSAPPASPASPAPRQPVDRPTVPPVRTEPPTRPESVPSPRPVAGPPQQRELGPADRARLMDALGKDPSLRYTESGRYLLRLFSTHLIPARRQQELAESVPAHCASAVSVMARECAAAWASLAEVLDQAAAPARR
ncbi:ParB/RepB/Spo0J family partition protein [Streptacidiphilus fuscans]|uniref:ParB N-terminal domain-containing protein n=1 Tax=Streptacidiphilus fuscans TaxID=2789292 RepID=A0A931AYW4_9ACTN|nr:winged helix-turn-helix transcriptional regulator [Streptacidiphilus fuscans]MBF9068080.1 ParB N-terminal domain-containing protein [Streptacidiphilus fuscans]